MRPFMRPEHACWESESQLCVTLELDVNWMCESNCVATG